MPSRALDPSPRPSRLRAAWSSLGRWFITARRTVVYPVVWAVALVLGFVAVFVPPYNVSNVSFLLPLVVALPGVLFLAATRSTRLWYAWLACFALPWLSISALLPLVLGVGWAWTATASLERIRQGR